MGTTTYPHQALPRYSLSNVYCISSNPVAPQPRREPHSTVGMLRFG